MPRTISMIITKSKDNPRENKNIDLLSCLYKSQMILIVKWNLLYLKSRIKIKLKVLQKISKTFKMALKILICLTKKN